MGSTAAKHINLLFTHSTFAFTESQRESSLFSTSAQSLSHVFIKEGSRAFNRFQSLENHWVALDSTKISGTNTPTKEKHTSSIGYGAHMLYRYCATLTQATDIVALTPTHTHSPGWLASHIILLQVRPYQGMIGWHRGICISHAQSPRVVTGAKKRRPKVKARWKISASKPAVRMSSASVTVNSGQIQDLHACAGAHACSSEALAL